MPVARRGKVTLATGAALAAIVAVVFGLVAGTGRAARTSPLAGTRSAAVRGTARPQVPASPDVTTPGGFWFGTDSSDVATPGPAPFQEPAIGSTYGGYIGMTGNWADWQNCGGGDVWSATDSAHARTNFVTYHAGIGVAGYWFMAGPGVDPRYNGTAQEASAWGAAQAAQVLADLQHTPTTVNYRSSSWTSKCRAMHPTTRRHPITGGTSSTPRRAAAG